MSNRFKTFAASVLQLNRLTQKIKEIEMKKFGLRANHTMCLYYLRENPEGLTSAELTELCHEDKAATSRSLAELTKKGLVESETPDDGKRSYRVRIRLTDKGREVAEKVNDRAENAAMHGGDGLTDDARNTFYSSMQTILKNLSEYIKKEKKKDKLFKEFSSNEYSRIYIRIRR